MSSPTHILPPYQYPLYCLLAATGVNRSKSKLDLSPRGSLYFFPTWTRLLGSKPAHEEIPLPPPLPSFWDVSGEDVMVGATAAILQL